MDPRVRRFIDLHGDGVRSVREEVAPFAGMSIEERSRRVSAALAGLATFLAADPTRREQILGAQDHRSAESKAL